MKSWLSGRFRLPVVSMMNCSVKKSDMLCSNNTDGVKPVSVEVVQVCLEKKKRCGTKKFLGGCGLMLGIFFLEERREQKVLKGISFSWQQLLRTELAFQMTFQRCRRHSTESSRSYRNGLCRKNKHLVEEEQSSEKKKSRKSKGNWREKNVGRGKKRGEESAPRQILAK